MMKNEVFEFISIVVVLFLYMQSLHSGSGDKRIRKSRSSLAPQIVFRAAFGV